MASLWSHKLLFWCVGTWREFRLVPSCGLVASSPACACAVVDPLPVFARLKRRGVGLVLPARGPWCGVRCPFARAGWFVLVLRSWCMVCLSSAEQRLEPRGVFVNFHLERQFCHRMFRCIVSGRFPRQGRYRGPLAQEHKRAPRWKRWARIIGCWLCCCYPLGIPIGNLTSLIPELWYCLIPWVLILILLCR